MGPKRQKLLQTTKQTLLSRAELQADEYDADTFAVEVDDHDSNESDQLLHKRNFNELEICLNVVVKTMKFFIVMTRPHQVIIGYEDQHHQNKKYLKQSH